MKYRFGHPFFTDALVTDIPLAAGAPKYFSVSEREGNTVLSCPLDPSAVVYGLGEQMRGINKRGWLYESWNTDDPIHHEGRTALYGAHNFFVVDGKERFGVFLDCAGRVSYDVGYTDPAVLEITARDFDLCVFEGESVLEIIKKFRTSIGKSYIPPKWAFGFAQSRWGYKSEEDIREVYENYRSRGLPLDMIFLDIDYMERFKDFTVDRSRFPDLKGLAAEMKEKGVRLIPIIDAAVKAEEGYPVYEEGIEKGYFCKDAEGKPFVVGVWPGNSVLPDVLSPDARKWFGGQYRVLLDQGVEGFWNDMNEPVLFYSERGLSRALGIASETKEIGCLADYERVSGAFATLQNNEEDYRSFYHETEYGRVRHDEVHNLYGYYMTRAAAEYFQTYAPGKRYLLFSRSSCVGMHRYGGVWTGDNSSWWSHLLLNLQQLPGLNMCGFLYAGADVGGFGGNVTEELLLRWIALGVFVPLMRNHSTLCSRRQECYRFGDTQVFRDLLGVRYALLPYLYSEFVRCALNGEMLFRAIAMDFPGDERARSVEDQLFVGDSLMIAPVYTQNAKGRYVYLPERMKLIRMRAGDRYTEEILEKGDHYISVPVEEIVFFLREGKALPLAAPAENVASLDEERLSWIKFLNAPAEVRLCRDDGVTLPTEENFVTIRLEP